MKTIALLTKSFLPDIDRFERLHESVLRFTDGSVIHHVIVPKRDVHAFQRIRSDRLRIWKEDDFLPEGFVATGGLAAVSRKFRIIPHTLNCSAVNLRRPWPPVRGWILQQILKLSAATRLAVDAVVIIDSDVVLVRPVSASTFFQGDTVRLYEKPRAVTGELVRHKQWTRTAHELLGLPWREEPDFPDYVGGIVSWDPAIVSECLRRVETVTGISWGTAVARNLHFSECILYGTFLRHFGTDEQRQFKATQTLCHSYWSPQPLDMSMARAFIDSYDGIDLAVHIQSNSGTSPDVIENVVAALSGDGRCDDFR